MSLENFRPKQAFEQFKQSIPPGLVGYRFEPHEFTQDSTSYGIFHRNYIVMDLNLSWAEMRKKRKELEGEFGYLSMYGASDIGISQDKFKTVNQALRYYETNPADYKSGLLLILPRKLGWFIFKTDLKLGYNHRDVPASFVKAEVSLQPEDFQQVRKLLSRRSRVLSSRNLQSRRLTERLLNRKLMKRFIQEIAKTNNDQRAEMSNG